MIPALAVVKLARIEVVRKWDYRHFGAQCLLVAQGCTDPAAPYRPLTGEHRPRIFAPRRCSARPSLPSRPREFHPEPLTDSGRDTLASSGSCHRTKAAAFLVEGTKPNMKKINEYV